MKIFNVISLIFAFVLILTACTGNGKKIDSSLHQEVVDEIEKMRPYFPYRIPNTSLFVDNIKIDGDIIEFNVSIPNSLLEDMTFFGEDVVNSDKNIARILSSLNQEQLNLFIKAGLGFSWIYKSSDTGDTLMKIDMDCNRIKHVKEGVDAGEIIPYTTLEIFQMEIDSYEFPYEIEEGIWVTDGYIKGNTVYYIANVESNITSDDLSYTDIKEIKQNILEGLHETIIVHKKEMEQNDIRVIYIYKNNNDDEFARVEITADDL